MRSTLTRGARLAALALALVACTADRLTGPNAIASGGRAAHANGPAGPVIRISEFHYDNTGTDANERIEVSGPAGASIDNWTIVRYNGAVAAAAVTYSTSNSPVIGGAFPNQCTGRGTLVFNYPVDGIQNGPNDGFALVNASGTVVEFLSYEGAMTASNGPAAGMTSTNIPVSELGTAAFLATGSIQRTPTGGWTLSQTTNTFGACNDNDGNTTIDPDFGPLAAVVITTASPVNITTGTTTTFAGKGVDAQGKTVPTAVITWSTPNPELLTVNANTGAATGVAVGDTKIVATSGAFSAEAIIHVIAPPPPPSTDIPPTHVSEFHYDNDGTDANEAIEIEGDAGVSIAGWTLALYTGNGGTVYNTIALTGTFAGTCNGRGALSFAVPGLQNGGSTTPEPDGFALVNGNGEVVQFLSYEGSFTATAGPAQGMASLDVGVEEPGTSTQSIQLNTASAWELRVATAGQVNACASATGTASISIAHSGPNSLVVGWQRRAFVTFRDANGTTVSPTPTITWTSDTPAIATVDPLGYATAVSAGSAVIRATIGTTTSTYTFSVINYEPVTAQYRNHLEFGMPTGADPANNILISKSAFVTSYNPARGGPNWVSWNINTSTFGDAVRCECFSPDVQLTSIAEAARISDQDYVNGGYDRGHMVQSESRTSTASENASSFLMTNILPQAAHNNQGIWLGFENFLNDQARVAGKQVYVVAGGEYAATPTTLKGAGRVAIPDYTWKVAIVVNNGVGLSDVHSTSDITMYAVRMPNLLATAPADNNQVYAQYLTTVDNIEARTGYDFFTALPDNIENVLEAQDHPPVASFSGATSGAEGSAITFDASGSSDPDAGDAITYQWTFTNGVTSTSVNPTVVFADNGSYTATLTVTDKFGATAQATKTITISNVAPSVAPFAGAAMILQGETYTSSGSFSDPGADTYSATVDYGDGAGANALTLNGTAFSLAHTYASGGTYTVTVTVTDDDGASTARTATVRVDHTPVAVFGGPMSGAEGSTLAFDASGSTDADAGDALSYLWTFSNGATSSSATISVAFGDNGSYTATLVVTDSHGATSSVTRTIVINNVAPTVSGFAGASIMRGEQYSASGTFSDPGPDTFSATVDYGDGTTGSSLLGAGSYALSHTYTTAGTFTVTFTISDDDGGATTRTATVTVASAATSIAALQAQAAALEAAGTLSKGEANALDASLKNALKSVQDGNTNAAANQLGAFINKVEAMQRSGRISAATAASLIGYANRIIASFG